MEHYVSGYGNDLPDEESAYNPERGDGTFKSLVHIRQRAVEKKKNKKENTSEKVSRVLIAYNEVSALFIAWPFCCPS